MVGFSSVDFAAEAFEYLGDCPALSVTLPAGRQSPALREIQTKPRLLRVPSRIPGLEVGCNIDYAQLRFGQSQAPRQIGYRRMS